MNYDPAEVKKLREQHALLQKELADTKAEMEIVMGQDRTLIISQVEWIEHAIKARNQLRKAAWSVLADFENGVFSHNGLSSSLHDLRTALEGK